MKIPWENEGSASYAERKIKNIIQLYEARLLDDVWRDRLLHEGGRDFIAFWIGCDAARHFDECKICNQ